MLIVTYGLGNGSIHSKSREDANILSILYGLNDLSTGNIRICSAIQQCRCECRGLFDGGSWDGGLDNMIL